LKATEKRKINLFELQDPQIDFCKAEMLKVFNKVRSWSPTRHFNSSRIRCLKNDCQRCAI